MIDVDLDKVEETKSKDAYNATLNIEWNVLMAVFQQCWRSSVGKWRINFILQADFMELNLIEI